MKLKNKGRKIYKTKEKNYYGKSVAGKILSAALSVLLLGGIGFLGYSVAEPIINYTKKQGDSDEMLPTVSSEASGVNTSFSENSSEPNHINAEQFRAAALKASDLSDAGKLNAALMNVLKDQNIEYISVPIKISGGEIYYASQVYEAQMCGAVKSELTLNDITSAIRYSGFKPVAEVSLLRDNIVPQTYPDTGYKTVDDGSRWIDNTVESGGKPWISPFSDTAKAYLNSIADEISAADFDKVIFSDVVFPYFRESDLELLGDEVKSSERYNALTSLANTMYSKMTNSGTAMMLEVSVVDILRGNCEVLQPMMLDVNTIVLDVDLDEMGSGVQTDTTLYEFAGTAAENTSKAIDLVKDKLSDYNVAVRLSGDSFSPDALADAKEVIADHGYSSFIIG